MGAAIVGELSIVASTGETLTSSTDIGLAWKWAEVEVNAQQGNGAWAALSYGEQCRHVADALAALRDAHAAAT